MDQRYNRCGMLQANPEQQLPTISREFTARLNRLGAKQKVRAIVLLQTGENKANPTKPSSRQKRKEAIEKVRQASRSSLPNIDQILAQHSGKRLSEEVDALGSIAVESTAEGIKALAASEHVKAIFEDQEIFPLSLR